MDARETLNLHRLPGRLNVIQVADLLGFKEHDIHVLVKNKDLEPLGKPAANAPKYFAKTTIVEHSEDPQWLHKATKHLEDHWKKKNQRRITRTTGMRRELIATPE